MKVLNRLASLVAVVGPVPGSLNGASTYCSGSSSVPSRASTMLVAEARTPAMMPPMLPVVSMANASVGPAPSSAFNWAGVISALMSSMNCWVPAMAAAAAVLWKLLCGEISQYSVSLLMPSRK
jgi:hypothetical protein